MLALTLCLSVVLCCAAAEVLCPDSGPDPCTPHESDKRGFNAWGGKRSVWPPTEQLSEDGDQAAKRGFSSWGGKRGFSSWGGKRSLWPPTEQLAEDGDQAAKRGFSSWGGKRGFNSWGGKRSDDGDARPDATSFGVDDAVVNQLLGGALEEKRTGGQRFSSWGGKRSGEDEVYYDKRAFNSWGGKRTAEESDEAEKRNRFYSWGGKRLGTSNSRGGKRGAEEDGKQPSAEEEPDTEKRGEFHSWGGKRERVRRAAEGTDDSTLFFLLQSWLPKRVSYGNRRVSSMYKAPRAQTRQFNPWGG